MVETRTRWDVSYELSGLDENWSQPLIDKYGHKTLRKCGRSIAPHNLSDIEIARFQQNNLDKLMPRNTDINVTEYTNIILDVLDCFSRSCPQYDKDIYRLYNNLNKKFALGDCELEDFYILCRKLEHINIPETDIYQTIQEINYKYNYNSSVPEIGSEWSVNYQNNQIIVTVNGATPLLDRNIIDANMHCTVKESHSALSFEKGDNIQLPPVHFNNGFKVS